MEEERLGSYVEEPWAYGCGCRHSNAPMRQWLREWPRSLQLKEEREVQAQASQQLDSQQLDSRQQDSQQLDEVNELDAELDVGPQGTHSNGGKGSANATSSSLPCLGWPGGVDMDKAHEDVDSQPTWPGWPGRFAESKGQDYANSQEHEEEQKEQTQTRNKKRDVLEAGGGHLEA